MVHLVSERPRESLVPILLQHCAGRKGKVKTSIAKNSFWRIAFPLYYVLLSMTCNLLFLVGSFLFLPIKERELTVSFTFVVEGVDVREVMSSNISLFQQLEQNFTGLLASDERGRIKPHHSKMQWRKTTSCSLDDAMLFDVNIYPRDGYSASALERSLPPVASIKDALNGSLTAIGIDRLASEEFEVNVLSRPRLVETAVAQKWAVDLGCNLFIIGSALLAFISGMDIFEDVLLCGASAKVRLEPWKLPFWVLGASSNNMGTRSPTSYPFFCEGPPSCFGGLWARGLSEGICCKDGAGFRRVGGSLRHRF